MGLQAPPSQQPAAAPRDHTEQHLHALQQLPPELASGYAEGGAHAVALAQLQQLLSLPPEQLAVLTAQLPQPLAQARCCPAHDEPLCALYVR